MKAKKIIALLMTVLMVGSILGACGKKDEGTTTTKATTVGDTSTTAGNTEADTTVGEAEPVKLKVWCPENQIQKGTINAMCESFQALNPQWAIEWQIEAMGEDVAKDEILKDVTAAGDIYFFASDQLQELVNAGAIAKLGGSTADMVNTTIAPSVVDTVRVGEDIYAIPFTHNTFFMYYDKSILSSDDITSVEKIMAKETADNVYNFCFDSAGGWKLGAWYYGAGLTIYGESQVDFAAGANWNNEKGLAVTNYLIDLINNPKCAYNDDVSLTELTGDHRVGAWFDGAWNYSLYEEQLGEDLGLAIIPTFNPDGNDYQLKGFYGSKAIGVNAQSAYMPAAVAFAAYLGGEEMQLKRFDETAQVPTNLATGASATVQSDILAAVIVEEANNASVMQPTSAEFNSRYWNNASGFATEIRSGEFNKSNAQAKLDQFVGTLAVQ